MAMWTTREEQKREKKRILVKILLSFVLFAVSVYLLLIKGTIK